MSTPRELMRSAVAHQEDSVPSWTMAFFDLHAARRLLGEDNVVREETDKMAFHYGAASPENMRRNLRYAEATGNCAIGVGGHGSFAFGHGGPGEFLFCVTEEQDNRTIGRYETGVKRKTQHVPHFYHHFDYPLETLDDIDALQLPDAADPARYRGIAEEATFYKDAGYYVYANLNGLFSGVHYFCYPYDKLFIDMIDNPDGLAKLIGRLTDFNLTAAENLLRCGVDSLCFCDDLGDGRSLLFSPALLAEFFLPYYRRLAELCHVYGAHLHMHSHGNILRILPLLVDTGIDIINPFDPYEVGPMAELKEAFGDRLTITGGLHKFFFSWDEAAMRDALSETIAAGRKGGGFVLMDSGGIPEDVTKTAYDTYRRLSAELRA